jgi:hypothetical protein
MYSIKFTRLKNNHCKVYTAITLDQIETMKSNMIMYISKKEYQGEKIEVIVKYHKDAAFDYEILSVDTIGSESL